MLRLPATIAYEPESVAAALLPPLREHYSDQQVAEMVLWSAVKTGSMRLAFAFGLEHEYHG
jgi:hypothetical protein